MINKLFIDLKMPDDDYKKTLIYSLEVLII